MSNVDWGVKRAALRGVLLWGILGLTILLPPSVWAGSNFTVYVGPPSGGDDTTILQAALDNCMTSHPKGCTIQLAAGTYESQQLIAENFNGTVQGMGMDATVVEVLAPLVVTVSDENVQDQPPSRTNKYPVLITFLAGNITVADMTFKVSAYNPTTPWCYGGTGCGQTWLEAPVGVVGSSANLLVERVGFEGGSGQIDGFTNYNNGALFWGSGSPLTGTFKLVSCRVSGSSNGWEVATVHKAQIIIGGSDHDGNVFENSELGGVMLDADNSVLEYSGNRVAPVANLGYAGLWVLQGVLWMPPEPSQFFIQNNTFETTGGYQDGIYVGDFKQSSGLGKSAEVFILNNSFKLAGSDAGPTYAGVELFSTVGSKVAANVFSGSALYGIAEESGTECALLLDDVAGVTAQNAPIWLDSGTSYCLVVGDGRPTLVLDQGTNDTLINVTKMPDSNAEMRSGSDAENAPTLAVPREMSRRTTPRLPW
jgi:hypothetical protein